MKSISSVEGWALNCVAELDRHVAGFAGYFLRASDERRQVVAAHLAIHPIGCGGRDTSAQIADCARMLMTAGHSAILHATFDMVPAGLRAALGRAGGQPHEPRFYRYLHTLLSGPPNTRAASTIAQMKNVDLRSLRVLGRLPFDMRSAGLVRLLRDVEYASMALVLISKLVNNGIDRPALIDAVTKAETREQLAAIWKRWGLKATFPPHPVPASSMYRPIVDGAGLREAARRYQNCAERYLAAALEGHSAFAEYEEGEHRAIIHLRKKREEWAVENIYGPGNIRVDHELRARALEHLAFAGLHEQRKPRRQTTDGWEALRRLASGYQFGDDDDDDFWG